MEAHRPERTAKPRGPAERPAAQTSAWRGARILFRAGLVILMASLAFAWIFLRHRRGSTAVRPAAARNVLLISVDTLRADHLGAYGAATPTPTLDRLAWVMDSTTPARITAHQAIRAAKVAGVPVYTVGLGEKSKRSLLSRVFPRPKRATPRGMDWNRLRELASSTGGRALFVADIQRAGRPLNPALRETFGRLSQELRCLYVLTYGPTEHGLDGRWHELYVEIRRPKLLARFRPGYLAAPPQ